MVAGGDVLGSSLPLLSLTPSWCWWSPPAWCEVCENCSDSAIVRARVFKFRHLCGVSLQPQLRTNNKLEGERIAMANKEGIFENQQKSLHSRICRSIMLHHSASKPYSSE